MTTTLLSAWISMPGHDRARTRLHLASSLACMAAHKQHSCRQTVLHSAICKITLQLHCSRPAPEEQGLASPLQWPRQLLLPEPCLQLYCRRWLASMDRAWPLPLQPPCTPQHQAGALLPLSGWLHPSADLDPPSTGMVCAERHGHAHAPSRGCVVNAPHPLKLCSA